MARAGIPWEAAVHPTLFLQPALRNASLLHGCLHPDWCHRGFGYQQHHPQAHIRHRPGAHCSPHAVELSHPPELFSLRLLQAACHRLWHHAVFRHCVVVRTVLLEHFARENFADLSGRERRVVASNLQTMVVKMQVSNLLLLGEELHPAHKRNDTRTHTHKTQVASSRGYQR